MTGKIETPTISVLLVTKNRLRYLKEAVGSLFQQTFNDFELIIVDDGSTDGTIAWLRNLETNNANVRILFQESLGLPAGLNSAAAIARGDYFARMDDDDVCLADRFKLQLTLLEQNSALSAVGGGVCVIDDAGRLLGTNIQPPDHDKIEAELLKGSGGGLTHPTLMMRRAAFFQIGGYVERYLKVQDQDLFLKLGEVGKLSNVQDVILYYRAQLDRSAFFAEQACQQREMWHNEILMAAYARRGLGKAPTVTHGRQFRSRYDLMLQLGLGAKSMGNFSSAFRYTVHAISVRPFALYGWRLLASLFWRIYSFKALPK